MSNVVADSNLGLRSSPILLVKIFPLSSLNSSSFVAMAGKFNTSHSSFSCTKLQRSSVCTLYMIMIITSVFLLFKRLYNVFEYHCLCTVFSLQIKLQIINKKIPLCKIRGFLFLIIQKDKIKDDFD